MEDGSERAKNGTSHFVVGGKSILVIYKVCTAANRNIYRFHDIASLFDL